MGFVMLCNACGYRPTTVQGLLLLYKLLVWFFVLLLRLGIKLRCWVFLDVPHLEFDDICCKL